MPQNPVPAATSTNPSSQGNAALEAFADFVKARRGAAPANTAAPAPQGTPAQAGLGGPSMTQMPAMPTMSMPAPQAPPVEQRPAGPGVFDMVAGSVQAYRTKKDQDELAKATNSMNMFLHAVQQNDMQTANMFAKDPKIIKSWERYLKMEFPRVPGVGEGVQKMPTDGQVNQPGGIAIPRDMTPEGNIRQQQLAAAQRVMGTQSDAQRALPVLGEGAGLSPEEFKKASRIKFGLDLDEQTLRTLDANAQNKMSELQADVFKFALGKEADLERQMAVAGVYTGATRDATRARLKIAQMHIDGMKDLAKKKGTQLTLGMYQQAMKTYQAFATMAEGKLATKDLPDDLKELYTNEYNTYKVKAEQAKEDYEGFSLAQELLFGDSDKEGDTNYPPAE